MVEAQLQIIAGISKCVPGKVAVVRCVRIITALFTYDAGFLYYATVYMELNLPYFESFNKTIFYPLSSSFSITQCFPSSTVSSFSFCLPLLDCLYQVSLFLQIRSPSRLLVYQSIQIVRMACNGRPSPMPLAPIARTFLRSRKAILAIQMFSKIPVDLPVR